MLSDDQLVTAIRAYIAATWDTEPYEVTDEQVQNFRQNSPEYWPLVSALKTITDK